MKYSPKYFASTLPSSKRKKDSLLAKLLIRPLSFVFSVPCAYLNFSANGVSLFSWFLAVSIIVLLSMNNNICEILGASLALVWNLCDCIDGNLARGVRKEKLGEYIDSMSSYFLTPGLIFCSGLMAFYHGGVLFLQGNVLPLALGGGAACCDIMSRLLFQKFQNCQTSEGNRDDLSADPDAKSLGIGHKLRRAENRIEAEAGISGAELLLIIFAVIFHFCDIFLLIYGGFAVLMLLAVVVFTNFIAIKKNRISCCDKKQ
jgi:hypothetical protein